MKRSEGGHSTPDKQATDPTHHLLNPMRFVMVMGWIFSLIWFIVDGSVSDLSNFFLKGEYLWATLFWEKCLFGIGFYFLVSTLGVIEATRVGVFLYFEPILTNLLAWPILGESMTNGAMVGGAAFSSECGWLIVID